jgi:hypothetical protein
MATKVLALASGVTGLADHRILNGAMVYPGGGLDVRAGVFPGPTGNGALSTVSAMVARVGPVRGIVSNSISLALGPYLIVSDANTDITFANGEASVSRVDRIILRAYDNANDASGDTKGIVEYLKGQASGSASALPNNSLLLYEMTVPAGASAGGGGVNFANAVDKRAYTGMSGGIIPIANATDMAAVANPYEGMAVYRTDLDTVYIHDGTNFKPRGQASVAAEANFSDITNPWSGMVATTRNNGYIYVYDGSSWNIKAGNYQVLYDQRTTDAAAVSSTTLTTMNTLTLGKVGTYTFEYLANYTNTGATGRPGFALGGTSTPTAWRWTSMNIAYNGSTGNQGFNDSGTTYLGSTSGTALVNSDLPDSSGFNAVHIKGTVTVSAGGTLTFRWSRTAGTSSVNVKKGTIATAMFQA